MKDSVSEVRVTGVSKAVHDELAHIAANNGVTISQLLRPKLREIANSYPPELRQNSIRQTN